VRRSGHPVTTCIAVVAQNEVFILSDPETRETYGEAFAASGALYDGTKLSFDQIVGKIKKWIDRL
jgi:hypothetical protein